MSRRSSHLQLISLGAPKKWPRWNLDIKNAFPQASGSDRGTYLRARCERNSKGGRRVSRLRAPTHRLNAAPVALHRTPRNYVANSVESLSRGGLRFEVSSSGMRQYIIFRKSGRAVGLITTHTDDILGCGEPDLPLEARCFSGKRFGKLKVQDRPSVHAGTESAHEQDFSETFTQEALTRNLKPLPTPPGSVGRPQGAPVAG